SISPVGANLNDTFVSAPGHPFADDDPITITGTVFFDTNGSGSDRTRDGSYVVSDRSSSGYRIGVNYPGSTYTYDPDSEGVATRTITVNYTSHTPSWKWAFSLFSDVNGWPEHGAFWRQRLVLMSGRVGAMSVTSDFENFSAKSP